MNRRRILLLTLAFAVAGRVAPAHAIQLAIANASFETPVFADGGFAFLNAQQGPYGWTLSDASFIYNPQAGDYAGAGGNGTPQGANGAQIAGVTGFGDYTLFQRLAGPDAMFGNTDDPQIEVGTVYTLTFNVGQRAAGNPFMATWGGYDIQLIAGEGPGAILLGRETDAVVPPAGQFVTRSFSIVSPTIAHPEAAGLPITILLRKTIVNSSATTEYDNIQIDATEIAPELNANFNGTGGVDAADLAIWKTNFGASSLNATHAKGNANADDYVDGQDFVLWQRQRTGGVAVAAPVPEPTTITLALALPLMAPRLLRNRP